MKNAFIVRAIGEAGENEYIITVGEHLASKRKFATKEEAEAEINKTNWDLTAAMVCAILEAKEMEKQEFIQGIRENIEEMN